MQLDYCTSVYMYMYMHSEGPCHKGISFSFPPFLCQSQLTKLEEQKASLEGELETLKQVTGSEEIEKAELLAAEKRAKAQVTPLTHTHHHTHTHLVNDLGFCLFQIEDLKKKFEDYRKDAERRKDHIKEEGGRKIKSLMEDNRHLQKELNAKKHEAQALMGEMESTAQAFEEMQEQNIRLLEQLKVGRTMEVWGGEREREREGVRERKRERP